MTKTQKQALLKILNNLFIKVYEPGGGYGFRYHHSLRMMNVCEKLIKNRVFKKYKIDKDALLISVLFHDLGKIKAVNKKGELIYGCKADKNHAEIGSKIIKKMLNKIIDANTLEKISIILKEQHSRKKTLIESKIVDDLDELDNYSLNQIFRHITYATYLKRNVDQVSEYWYHGDGRKCALEGLKKIYIPAIKKIAMQRFMKLDNLIKEMKREYMAKDIKV